MRISSPHKPALLLCFILAHSPFRKWPLWMWKFEWKANKEAVIKEVSPSLLITRWAAASSGRSYSSTPGKVGPREEVNSCQGDSCCQDEVWYRCLGAAWALWGDSQKMGRVRSKGSERWEREDTIWSSVFSLRDLCSSWKEWTLELVHCTTHWATQLARSTVANANWHGILSRSEAYFLCLWDVCLHPPHLEAWIS